MAKKKKHRKTRKQKLARANQQKNNLGSEGNQEIVEPKQAKIESTIVDREVSDSDINAIEYVKKDIKKSLLLATIIFTVFVIIYIILAKTQLGSQIYSIIKL